MSGHSLYTNILYAVGSPRIKSRMTSVASLPVSLHITSNVSASCFVKLIVIRLAAHFFFHDPHLCVIAITAIAFILRIKMTVELLHPVFP